MSVYGLNEPKSRILQSAPSTENSHWYVASPYKIHLLEYIEPTNEIICSSNTTSDKIINLNPIKNSLFICYSNYMTFNSIKKQGNLIMNEEFTMDGEYLNISPCKDNFIACQSNKIICFDFQSTISTINTKATFSLMFNDLILFSNGSSINQWDTRLNTSNVIISEPHKVYTRYFDCNRNHLIATCGDDMYVRLWDFRKTDSPVLQFKHHSHWIYKVKFNPFHDQLLLSCGSDNQVNLESIVSISSAIPQDQENIKEFGYYKTN